MELKVNQKVIVTKMIRDDGTCAGCKRGMPVAMEGQEGFVCDIQEFHFEPVYVVHFIETNRKVGFRAPELEVLEDFDDETGKWTVVKDRSEVEIITSCGGENTGGGCGCHG